MIHATRYYELEDRVFTVEIGHGNLWETDFSWFGLQKFAILYDRNVDYIAGHLAQKMQKDEAEPNLFPFDFGEARKNFATVDEILQTLAGAGVNQHWGIISLGGGVTLDVVGLAAHLYHRRNIPYIAIPTTLTAGIGVCIGGKVAVNVGEWRNYAGWFHPAEYTIDDIGLWEPRYDEDTAQHINQEAGLGELTKIALVGDNRLFKMLQTPLQNQKRKLSAFRRAIDANIRLVVEDPFDTGERALLNYGHTTAHALESSLGVLPHGKAVAIGMMVSAYLAQLYGYLPQTIVDAHKSLLLLHNLPTGWIVSGMPVIDSVIAHARGDKKSADCRIHDVLLEDIGKPHRHGRSYKTPIDEATYREALRKALIIDSE